MTTQLIPSVVEYKGGAAWICCSLDLFSLYVLVCRPHQPQDIKCPSQHSNPIICSLIIFFSSPFFGSDVTSTNSTEMDSSSANRSCPTQSLQNMEVSSRCTEDHSHANVLLSQAACPTSLHGSHTNTQIAQLRCICKHKHPNFALKKFCCHLLL